MQLYGFFLSIDDDDIVIGQDNFDGDDYTFSQIRVHYSQLDYFTEQLKKLVEKSEME